MDQIRFTSLHNKPSAAFGQSFVAGMNSDDSPTNPTANQGVDEFVFDPSNGTFASFQQPVSMTSLLNNDRSYSFVI
jgi:hypothetical protein